MLESLGPKSKVLEMATNEDESIPNRLMDEAIRDLSAEWPAFTHNFLILDEEEKQILRKRIEVSKGTIRIVVHPYFMRTAEDYERERQRPGARIDIVEKSFERMLAQKGDTPILLFEGYDQIPSTLQEIFSILQNSGNELYILPTIPNDPTPVWLLKEKESWKKFVGMLKDLGVKKCIIGGIYFWHRQRAGDYAHLNGCVGGTIHQLKDYFEIQVSNLAHPQSRKDVGNPDITPNS